MAYALGLWEDTQDISFKLHRDSSMERDDSLSAAAAASAEDAACLKEKGEVEEKEVAKAKQPEVEWFSDFVQRQAKKTGRGSQAFLGSRAPCWPCRLHFNRFWRKIFQRKRFHFSASPLSKRTER